MLAIAATNSRAGVSLRKAGTSMTAAGSDISTANLHNLLGCRTPKVPWREGRSAGGGGPVRFYSSDRGTKGGRR